MAGIVPTDTRTAVQTVLGPVAASELGVTLPHEHFLCTSEGPNFAPVGGPEVSELADAPVSLEIRGWLEFNWQSNHDNLVLDDLDVAVAEAIRYRAAGGRTIVDVTPIGIGREPSRLARIAREAHLNVVMGCAYYVGSTHPAQVREQDADAVAQSIVDEFAAGVEGSGIRPGVIGEVGCSWPLLPDEEKVLRAAATAQRELGVALYVHPGRHPAAPAQILGILSESGALIERVVICHIERTIQDLDTLRALLDAGCYIEYDLFGMETTGTYYAALGITLPSDSQRLDQIRLLFDEGHGERILMSHDICFKHRLARYGGGGYDHILTNVVPRMAARGFSADDVDTILVENPRRLLERAGTPQ